MNLSAIHSAQMIKHAAVMIVALAMLVIWPSRAYTCACCANGGEWEERTGAMDMWELEILNLLKLDHVAARCGNEDPDEFRISLSRTQSRWTISFRNTKGEKGALVLHLAQTMKRFIADLPEGIIV